MFLTVGIGASAGGLDAFKSFFAATPADTGMAFVLVQHLSPDHKSMLAELIDKTTAMDVIEATDGVLVKPNCVFVIPPNATMTMANGSLKIVRPAPPRDRRRPIDTFFQSLAEDQGDQAICIILSGTGSDGAQGLTAVKENGGLTLAQAEYDSHALPGMPQSAANTGLVDDILSVESMPARIISYQKHFASVAQDKDDEGVRQDTATHLTAILRALHARSGHNFREYKEKTLIRRLQRRMQVLQVESPEAYMERLAKTPEELDSLLRELLIGVTQFFRDPAAFDALNETVLRDLVAGKGTDEEIRVWVPGCATGEEAYTIAILLREAMEVGGVQPKVQIFGTDLDERAITLARLGCYKIPIAGLSPERAERWFSVKGEDCRVVPSIREMCIFSEHSVIKHPPYSKLDLISCRNLLIYLDASMQERVMRTFHWGLRPGGRLFLGSSESVSRAKELFVACDKQHRIFERRNVTSRMLPTFTTDQASERTTRDAEAKLGENKIDKSVRRLIAKNYPPHLVLDNTNQIVRFSSGQIAAFLEPSAGPPSFALFDILHKSLRRSAREVLREVRTALEPVRRIDIPVRIDGMLRSVILIGERLDQKGPGADLVVLTFQDAGPVVLRAKGNAATLVSDQATEDLEQELRTNRIQFQSMIDELETANEEMKSSNEEYQSVNEELQSTNEELETAKEEMQSINEELQTINSEMAVKNEQLTKLGSDMSNLLDSTEFATLFLDGNLCIRRFTRGMNELFHLRETDIGRPITEIVSQLAYDELQHDVERVLREMSPIERDVMVRGADATFKLRIRPYRTIEKLIDGVVLTFVNISDSKRHDEQQELLLKEMDHRIKNLFAIAGGVVSLSARSAATPQEMATTVQARLGALASAHQLVRPQRLGAGTPRSATTLSEIIQTILRPYLGTGDAEEESRIVTNGPDVAVGGDAVTSMAMVLHELATNAAKYGALSKAGGQLQVTWTIKKLWLELSWTERGGPLINGPPEREGFGSLLARRSVSGQLDGELIYDWAQEGLTVHLSASAERLGR
jgi:two-component system CheB/CheR fusion protein